MVEIKQAEKKTPITVLETKVDDKTYQFVAESDSSYDNCLNALSQFTDYVRQMKEKDEEKELKTQENQEE